MRLVHRGEETMAAQDKRLRTVIPDIGELLPTAESRVAYADAEASIEAGRLYVPLKLRTKL